MENEKRSLNQGISVGTIPKGNRYIEQQQQKKSLLHSHSTVKSVISIFLFCDKFQKKRCYCNIQDVIPKCLWGNQLSRI